jgi:hypothetical protein
MTMQQEQTDEFSDIRTLADVEKLAAEDWPRYVRWDAAQKKIRAAQAVARPAQENPHCGEHPHLTWPNAMDCLRKRDAAEIERLRAALKPFAECPWAGDVRAYPATTSVVAAGLNIGHFREAKRAVEQGARPDAE